MKPYLDLLETVIKTGAIQGSRAVLSDGSKPDTLSTFGLQTEYDLTGAFPIVTTKKIPFRQIVVELLWFLSGSSNIRPLQEQGVHIWDAWTGPNLEVGGPSDHRPLAWVPVRQAGYSPLLEKMDLSTDELDAPRGTVDDRLRGTWRHMMGRCYDPTHHRYSLYGAKGVCVTSRWHDPVSFVADVKTLPNWGHKLKSWCQYELDKDYYGSNCYSPETTVWLHEAENNYYRGDQEYFQVKSPDGVVKLFLNPGHAEAALDISRSTLYRLASGEQDPATLKGNNGKARGWSFSKVPPREGHVLRMALSDGDLGVCYGKTWRDFNGVDQIANLLRDIRKVVANPQASEARRLIITAWNPAEMHYARGPVGCHTMVQFYVRGSTLSCKMYQRSADMFLGVPWNISCYALLTHLVATATGLVPLRLIHTFGDAHIYDNHLDQVTQQLSRAPYPCPNLIIDGDVGDLNDLRPEQFRLEGYRCHPAIRGEVAV